MCSIIASFNREKMKELIDLNQFRGNFSYSYTEINESFNNEVNYQEKDFGPFPTETIASKFYKIGHVQAPTNGMEKYANRIHPVTNTSDNSLWHNGLIQPRGIRFLQEKLGTDEVFDTKLLFNALEKFGFDILSEIEGLFSCLYIRNGRIFIFRTKHGKLYVDDNLNISSERFDNSKCINADTIYEVDPEEMRLLEVVKKFKTKRFNFIVKGEM